MGAAVGGFVRLRIAFGDFSGAFAGISKTRAAALRQFEIPYAKAPEESFAETAPMQPDKPAHSRPMPHRFTMPGNNTSIVLGHNPAQKVDCLKNLRGKTSFLCCCGLDGSCQGSPEDGAVFEATLSVFTGKFSQCRSIEISNCLRAQARVFEISRRHWLNP